MSVLHDPEGRAGRNAIVDIPRADQVGQLARSGASWTLLQIVARQLLSIAATVVLARFLSAEDYGLIGMVATITALFSTVTDLGLSMVTIAERDLTKAQIDSLHWINVGTGVLLCLGCVASGPLLADFYDRDELTAMTAALGGTFVFGAFAVQPQALLTRQMRLKRSALAEIAAITVGSVAGIGFAVAGWGYWALVGQSLVIQSTRALTLTIASGYRPGAPQRGVGTRRLVTSGGLLTMTMMCAYFARNVDNVLIGRVWGAEELGYYSRAYFLMTLPATLAIAPLSNSMVAALAALRHDADALGQTYRKAMGVIAWVGCPIAAGMAVAAPETIRLVYGPSWSPVVPLLAWLSLSAVLLPIYSPASWLFMCAGKNRAFLLWTAPTTGLLVAGFAVGVQWGALGVAVAHTVVTAATSPLLGNYLAHRVTGLDPRLTATRVLPILACTAIMAVSAWTVGQIAGGTGGGWAGVLVAKVLTGVIVYAIACWWLVPDLTRGVAVTILLRLTGRRSHRAHVRRVIN